MDLAAGIAHFSAHLTRDLDAALAGERSRGRAIPEVVDPDEYNVPYIRVAARFPDRRFAPEVQLVLHPVNLRLPGGVRGWARPVLVSTRWMLRRGQSLSLVAESQHELGSNGFTHATFALEYRRPDAPERRLQIFISASPGRQLHVSPTLGGLRDGVAWGLRMRLGE
jgi:hypothetical protein